MPGINFLTERRGDFNKDEYQGRRTGLFSIDEDVAERLMLNQVLKGIIHNRCGNVGAEAGLLEPLIIIWTTCLACSAGRQTSALCDSIEFKRIPLEISRSQTRNQEDIYYCRTWAAIY